MQDARSTNGSAPWPEAGQVLKCNGSRYARIADRVGNAVRNDSQTKPSAEANLSQGSFAILQLWTPEPKPLGEKQTDELAVGEEITAP